jgi:hypothetical protein
LLSDFGKIKGMGLLMNKQLAFKVSIKISNGFMPKKEGDDFQADLICEKGFTYSYYFHNVAAPKTRI